MQLAIHRITPLHKKVAIGVAVAAGIILLGLVTATAL
jgi:hypothetical protein